MHLIIVFHKEPTESTYLLKENIGKETIFSTHSAPQFHILAIPPYHCF